MKSVWLHRHKLQQAPTVLVLSRECQRFLDLATARLQVTKIVNLGLPRRLTRENGYTISPQCRNLLADQRKPADKVFRCQRVVERGDGRTDPRPLALKLALLAVQCVHVEPGRVEVLCRVRRTGVFPRLLTRRLAGGDR